MPAVPANLGQLYWSNPRQGWGSFRPKGKVLLVNPAAHPNPFDRRAGNQTLAARFFVGFNVGGEPKWSVDDVIGIVQNERDRQGKSPDASFIAQKGIYSSGVDRSVVVEDGAQIIILNFDEPVEKFTEQMMELGEALRSALQQELIILEMQQAGVTIETIGIT
jgi:hypothetical protein